MSRAAISVRGLSVRGAIPHGSARALPEEVPVALVYDGTTQAVMMASPQDLEDFALGFSLTEGIVSDLAQIEGLEIVTHGAGIEARIWLAKDCGNALARRRRMMAGPVGCGLCGIDSLEEALRPVPQVGAQALRLTPAEVDLAVNALAAAQPLHDRTRAVHAAGLYRPGAGMVLTREDVGRHNALDKLAGALAAGGTGGAGGAVVLTSRISVELVQKTAIIGAPVLIALSAPTAHAVRLAEGAGLTLIGLARGQGFDIFAHPHRIALGGSDVA